MTYYMRSEDYKRLGIEERLEDGTWTMELQEDFEKSSQIDAGVVRNWEAFGKMCIRDSYISSNTRFPLNIK